jgi:hypothetical protein
MAPLARVGICPRSTHLRDPHQVQAAPCRFRRCWAVRPRPRASRSLLRHTTRRTLLPRPHRHLNTAHPFMPRLACTRPLPIITPFDVRRRQITSETTIRAVAPHRRLEAITRPRPMFKDTAHRNLIMPGIHQPLRKLDATLAGCRPALPIRRVTSRSPLATFRDR